ncbi:MAG: FAD-dependent oxidoreductase [Chloroflexota bacterium]|nr:FAD-dependent oxidoreductase [Chloroflexota bacterium]|tara:strand:- start:545 stop:1591 length:1047 start_codon:yes stop_codon:yes gene_type:complete
MKEFDLIIIGSGIVGSSLAYYSAKKKKEVLIIEKNFSGFNSSGTAQGGLAPYLGDDQEIRDLHIESFSLHKNLKDNILNESNINPFYSSKKLFHIISSKDEILRLENVVSHYNDPKNFEFMDEQEIRQIEPKLRSAEFGALVFNDYMEVDSFSLTNSLKEASINLGTEFMNYDFSAQNMIIKNSKFQGVNIEGEIINSNRIAFTSGPWTRVILEDHIDVDVKPLKGQMIKAKTDEEFANSFSWGRDYATKKIDGYIWIGTTEEHVDFQEGITEEAEDQILSSFKATFSGFSDLNIKEQTACFRPYSNKNQPILKKSSEIEGIYIGTGSGRNGIKLGPAMGKRLSDMIF